MFVFPYSNGITEGFHRKMKLIQRRAYGFRNFENYRLRVIVLCGHLPQKLRPDTHYRKGPAGGRAFSPFGDIGDRTFRRHG
jgi:hypothetical protein